MKKIALMLMAAIAVIACNPQDEIVPEIKVTTTDFTLPLAGTEDMSFKVQFTTNVAWTAALKEASEWCTITPSSGEAGDASVTVIALANPTKENRTAVLVITAGTAVEEVTLTQLQTDAYELVESSATVGAEGGEYALKVMTNVDYTVVVPEDVNWITVASTKAYAESTTTLNVAAFDELDATRSATLTVKAEGLEDLTFTLTQEGPKSKLWSIDLTSVASRIGSVTNAVNETFAPMYSLAAFGDNLVLCIGDGSALVLLDKETGEKVGTLDTGTVKPMSIANDDAGNLIITNRVYNYWVSYEFFTVWYIKAGTTDVVKLLDIYADYEYYASYIGASVAVRGDVTKNAVIGTAWEGVEGVSGENMLLVFDVVNGDVPEYKKLTLAGVQAIDWWAGYWCNAPGNYPGYAFLGDSSSKGGLLSVYNQNLLNHFDGTGACTLAVETALADGNYAANSLEIREINGKQYLAVACGCHFPEYGIAPNVVVYDLETKQPVAVPMTTNYALTGEVDGEGNPLYMAGVAATSDVVLEASGAGFNVYYVDNNCSAIEAFHYDL